MRSGELESQRAGKRGSHRIDKAETGRERRGEGGVGPAPLGLSYSLLLSAIGSQNGIRQL